jgi:tetratricopeptide (TPR) repeat protein
MLARLVISLVILLALAAIIGVDRTGGVTILENWESMPQRAVTREGNSNYPQRNPFYFEGKIDYELLGIDEPRDAWEFMQRGMHKQDDLEDFEGAEADYRQSIGMNNLENGTCQIITEPPGSNFGSLTPPPCMFTVRSRLGYLLLHDHPEEAIELFREVLEIDPLRLEIHALIGEAYVIEAEHAHSEEEAHEAYLKAIEEFKKELELSPVTAEFTALTGDEANNAHIHFEMAEVYEHLGEHEEAIHSFENYLKATKWHSDVYPWRIPLVQKKLEALSANIRPNLARRQLRGGPR